MYRIGWALNSLLLLATCRLLRRHVVSRSAFSRRTIHILAQLAWPRVATGGLPPARATRRDKLQTRRVQDKVGTDTHHDRERPHVLQESAKHTSVALSSRQMRSGKLPAAKIGVKATFARAGGVGQTETPGAAAA